MNSTFIYKTAPKKKPCCFLFLFHTYLASQSSSKPTMEWLHGGVVKLEESLETILSNPRFIDQDARPGELI